MGQDWRIADHYAAVARAERKALAWEWLRRTDRYRAVWKTFASGRCEHSSAREFGLVRYEDPDLPTPAARPLWSAHVDPSVVTARITSFRGNQADLIDLLAWQGFVSIAIDDELVEHLLLSNGEQAVRLDIVAGTLLGCPARVAYDLDGVLCLAPKLSSLRSLITATSFAHRFRLHPADRILDRWILELRVADALRHGASHRDIAQVLFGTQVPDQRWRAAGASYRLRVQRLVRRVKHRLASPLEGWFSA